MGYIKSFLETSTIHGLYHISSTRKNARLFWILVVIAGFSGAGYMIYRSFKTWDESPVITTIESRPIADITFPKLTVCPPKETYTDLNYDIMTTENKTFEKETRNNISNYAIELLYDHLHENMMKNISKLLDTDRLCLI